MGLALCLALAAAPRPAAARSFIWKVEPPAGKGGATSHLIGSIHLANKALYPLPPPMEAAFAAAEVLVVEARVDQAAQLMGQVMQHAMYRPPDTLEAHLSKQTLAQLRNRLKTTGLPSSAWMQMKPWVIAMTLSALDLKDLGYDPQLGIDMHFLTRARAGGKAISELEGAAFQLKLFSDLDDKEQEQYLLYTLARSKLVGAKFAQLIELWKAGDHRGLHRAMTASMQQERRFRKIFKRLITDRNHSMTRTIVRLLAGERSRAHLFVVGAGHLTGPQGIVKLLQRRGYRLTQL